MVFKILYNFPLRLKKFPLLPLQSVSRIQLPTSEFTKPFYTALYTVTAGVRGLVKFDTEKPHQNYVVGDVYYDVPRSLDFINTMALKNLIYYYIYLQIDQRRRCYYRFSVLSWSFTIYAPQRTFSHPSTHHFHRHFSEIVCAVTSLQR